MDPTKKSRVGYLTSFEGLDLTGLLKQDVTVYSPFESSAAAGYTEAAALWDKSSGKMKATGVIESMTYNGGVGDPICISAYISAENAVGLSAKMKGTLTTTKITKLGWWIVNFDEENKAWFEESYPKAPANINGQINAPGGKDIRLTVAAEPTKVASNIDVNVYNVYFEIVPAANQTFELNFASSVKTPFVRNWGLVVGTNAAAALPAVT